MTKESDYLWLIRIAAHEKHTTATETTLQLIERLATEAVEGVSDEPSGECEDADYLEQFAKDLPHPRHAKEIKAIATRMRGAANRSPAP